MFANVSYFHPDRIIAAKAEATKQSGATYETSP